MSGDQRVGRLMDLAYRRAREQGPAPAPSAAEQAERAASAAELTRVLREVHEAGGAPAPTGSGAMFETPPSTATDEETPAMRESAPKRTVLLDIDTQIDFCSPVGALFVPGAAAPQVRDQMRHLVQAAASFGVVRIATADDHQLSDREISDAPDFQTTFPPHCLRGTDGAIRIQETRLWSPLVLGDGPLHDDRLADLVGAHHEILVLKQHFNAFTNPYLDRVLDLLAPERVIVFGVALDICVNAALEGLVRRRSYLGDDSEICVVEEAGAGLDPERIASCQRSWDASRIRRVTTREAIDMMRVGATRPMTAVEA